MIEFSDLVAGFYSLSPERKIQFLRAIGSTYEGEFYYSFDKVLFLKGEDVLELNEEIVKDNNLTCDLKPLTIVAVNV